MSTRSLLAALAALLFTGACAAASDGATRASEHGCLNCHHEQSHASPTLRSLSDKFARGGDSPEALRHLLAEMREKDTVHCHVMVTDESALAILQWMAQGAK